MADRDYEKEAREQGWKPEDEFKGPEGKWTDSKTFVEKGEKIAGILKSRLDRQDSQIKQLQNANKEFGDYQQTLLSKQKERNADLLAELEAQKATAITDSDGAAAVKIDREIDRVRQELTPPPPGNGQQQNPLAEAWLMNNAWYNDNPKLKTYADGLAEVVEREGYSGPAYFTEITRRVHEDFPEEFQNKRQTGANTVEEGGEIITKDSNAQTYENLDAEGQAACDRFVKSGLTTKEEFCENYDWE